MTDPDLPQCQALYECANWLETLASPTLHNDRMAAEARTAQQRLDELASMLCDAPPDGPGNGAGQDDAHGMGHGMADGMAHPPIVVAGAVVGAVAVAHPSPEKQPNESDRSVSNTRARLELVAHCYEHPGQLRRNCSGCAADRKAAESA